MKGRRLLLTLFLLASLGDVHSDSCDSQGWSYDEPSCPAGTAESYMAKEPGGQYLKQCCSDPTDVVKNRNTEKGKCHTTPCITDGRDACATVEAKRVGGKWLKYKENMREKCVDASGINGVAVVCCPSNSNNNILLSIYGAEMNEFPHQANVGGCGGTVYNKDYIITAAHCVVTEGHVDSPPPIVKLGTNIGELDSKKNTYEVERIIVHDYYSKLANQSETMGEYMINDIALLKLKKSINFNANPNIKALKIAPANFTPSEYADQAVLAGWGTTIELTTSEHLNKANLPIRTYEQCYGEPKLEEINGTQQWTKPGVWSHDAKFADQYLCIGGIVDGSYAEVAAPGDSGGPAICRDKEGYAVLCGISSNGAYYDECAQFQTDEFCIPSIFASISHFRDWIEEHAGEQDESTFYKVPLYGKNVPLGKYKHQVHIEANDGTVCGGTLVSQDKVVTAGHCVLDDNAKKRTGLKVYAGVHNLNKKRRSNLYKVVGVRGVDTFERYHEMDKLASEKYKTMRNAYYVDDLAVVKLNRKVPIDKKELPKLATRYPRQRSAVEVAFPLNTSRSGSLMQRDFKILDNKDCKLRVERLGQLNTTADFDTKKVFCAVEKYSGGSICDREDGGGVFCKNAQGQHELCGIQAFRLCRTSLPSAFLSVGTYNSWIKEALSAIDKI